MSREWTLIDAPSPDPTPPEPRPVIGREIHQARLDSLRRVSAKAGLDAVVIYADREHAANLAWLTGFEPRFEEALLIVPPGADPVLITGPENQSYAAVSPLDLALRLYPPFGLLGQDRGATPQLADLLDEAGLHAGQRIGVAGWKYFTASESPQPARWLEIPAYLADALRGIAGEVGVINAGALFMDPTNGLRAVNDIDQIAQFEHAACHASDAVARVIAALRPGMSEAELAGEMRLGALPLSCHAMLSSGPRTALGLASPSDRVIGLGEPFQVAIGVWGGLTCRAARVAAGPEDLPDAVRNYVDRLAGPYFACAAEWLETVGLGVPGGDLDALVRRRLGDPFFGLALNPGHLIGFDEWMHTPIRPGSRDRLMSGQALQLDIIPATGTAYGTVNIEDGIALLDARGRTAFAEKYPAAWRRIGARRAFMTDRLGIRPKPELLPLSNMAGRLAPYLLAPGRILARADALRREV